MQLLIAASLWTAVSSSYVIIRPSVPRCFAEGIPAGIPVAVTYRVPEFKARGQALPPTGLEIEVTNPRNDVLDIHYITSERGRYEFSSTDTELGLHEICFHTNASTWDPHAPWAHGFLRVEIDIEIGSEAIDWDAVATRDHLTDLEVAVSRARRDVDDALVRQRDAYRYDNIVAEAATSLTWRLLFWGAIEVAVTAGAGPFHCPPLFCAWFRSASQQLSTLIVP